MNLINRNRCRWAQFCPASSRSGSQSPAPWSSSRKTPSSPSPLPRSAWPPSSASSRLTVSSCILSTSPTLYYINPLKLLGVFGERTKRVAPILYRNHRCIVTSSTVESARYFCEMAIGSFEPFRQLENRLLLSHLGGQNSIENGFARHLTKGCPLSVADDILSVVV